MQGHKGSVTPSPLVIAIQEKEVEIVTWLLRNKEIQVCWWYRIEIRRNSTKTIVCLLIFLPRLR